MIPRRGLLTLMIATGASMALLPLAAHAQPYPPPPYPPVPPPRSEFVPVAPPGRRVVWEPGHWHWNGRGYVWIGGHYIEPRPQYTRYVPGAWVRRGPQWVWVPAHWERVVS